MCTKKRYAKCLTQIDGKKLTEIINHDHVNSKYLPNIKLPDNVVAMPKVEDVAKNATLLVFVLPHQVRRHANPVYFEHLQSAQGPHRLERACHLADQRGRCA